MTTLYSGTITTAATATSSSFTIGRRNGYRGLSAQANFTYGSGGTTVDVYIDTSIDGGSTWINIIHFTQFTTASGRRATGVQQATGLTADIDGTANLAAAT